MAGTRRQVLGGLRVWGFGTSGSSGNGAILSFLLLLFPLFPFPTHDFPLPYDFPTPSSPGVDNGKLWFDNVRVPRGALLNAFSEVSPDGAFKSSISKPRDRFLKVCTYQQVWNFMAMTSRMWNGFSPILRFCNCCLPTYTPFVPHTFPHLLFHTCPGCRPAAQREVVHCEHDDQRIQAGVDSSLQIRRWVGQGGDEGWGSLQIRRWVGQGGD